jgi:MFS family permease
MSLLDRIRANKNTVVWVTAIALFNDLLIYGIVVPILPDYTAALGSSPLEIGILFASYSAGILIATPAFGIFADRYGRRRPVLFALAALAISTVFFGIGQSYIVLLLARFIQGVSAAGTWVCGIALLYDVFDSSEIGEKLSFVMTLNGIGYMVGPLVGGFLYRYVSYLSAFLVCAALVLVDGLARFYFIPDALIPLGQQQQPPPPESKQDAADETSVELPSRAAHEAAAADDAHANVEIDDNDDWTSLPHPDPLGTDAHAFATYATAAPLQPPPPPCVPQTALPAAYSRRVDSDLGEIDIGSQPSSLSSMWQLACDPYVATNLMHQLMSTALFSSVEPILPLHFAQVMNSTPDQVGMLFFALVLPYVGFTIPAGWLADRYDKRALMTAGLVLLCFGAPLACLPRSPWVELFALAPVGVGLALCVSPGAADVAECVAFFRPVASSAICLFYSRIDKRSILRDFDHAYLTRDCSTRFHVTAQVPRSARLDECVRAGRVAGQHGLLDRVGDRSRRRLVARRGAWRLLCLLRARRRRPADGAVRVDGPLGADARAARVV